MTVAMGDDDPEDALTATDPAAQRLDVADRWVASIAAELAGPYDETRMIARVVACEWLLEQLRQLRVGRREVERLSIRLDRLAAELHR